jgi:lipoyl(octanoyl) transferase
MSSVPPDNDPTKRRQIVGEFHFLGCVAWEDVWSLQQRLIYETSGRRQPNVTVLFCEHPDLITVGRRGSRMHIRMTEEELRHERLPLRWVGRGGGCVLHTAGQLCVYPILSLPACGWTVGQYLRRFHEGFCAALENFSIRGESREGQFGVWGRSGLLAAFGVAVQRGVTCQGAFLNVSPYMSRFARIDTVAPEEAVPGEKTTMSCLLAERRLAVRMASVRASLVDSLSTAFDCGRHYLHTGHPLLRQRNETSRDHIARAS